MRSSPAARTALTVMLFGATAAVSQVAAVPPPGTSNERTEPPPVTSAHRGVARTSIKRPADVVGDFVGTGGDTCAEAAVIDVPVGPPGSPTTVTIRGDSHGVTGPDCGGSLPTVWWEAFHIDACATVIIDYCQSPPRPGDSNPRLADDCSPDGSSCGSFFLPDSVVSNECGDGNLTITFSQVPPSTYYFPVTTSSPDLGPAPYRLHITAEQCSGACDGCLGACCDADNRMCVDGTLPTECTGPTEAWQFRKRCCELECRPAEILFNARNVELQTWLPIDDFPGLVHSVNEMWGYVSPAGREYAIIGFTTATGFVDVTDPANARIIAVIDGNVDTIWRDMDVIGTYAYVVSDGRGVGLQVMDLSRIDEGVVDLVNTTDLGVDFATAHNIRANAESGFLYLAIPNLNNRQGLTALDASDPIHPTVAGAWTDDTESNVRCHDLQVVSYSEGPYAGREIAFCFAEDNGVKIVDVTDKANMFTMATLRYPTVRYTHQGWLSVDRRYVFIDDELDERTLPDLVPQTTTYVGDVQDLENPKFLTSFTGGQCTIDHNLMVHGPRVYEANYTSGLRVFDVTDIQNVQEVAFFDTHPEDNSLSFTGAWGVYVLPSGTVLVSDRQQGLFVLRLTGDAFPPGDCDGDGDRDMHDAAVYQNCFGAGNLRTLPGACGCADTQRDDDVDLDDFAKFLGMLGGP